MIKLTEKRNKPNCKIKDVQFKDSVAYLDDSLEKKAVNICRFFNVEMEKIDDESAKEEVEAGTDDDDDDDDDTKETGSTNSNDKQNW